MSEPSYYANIPAPVRYCSAITPNAKLLYGEITALCNKEGYCWASNLYFAKLYGKNAATISEWIASLKRAGFIDVEIDKTKGNERKIYLAEPMGKKAKRYGQKGEEGYGQKGEGNNKGENNTPNSNVELGLEVEETQTDNITPQDFFELWNSLPQDFPEIRAMTSGRITKLRARLREPDWRRDWRAAFARMPDSAFLSGKCPPRRNSDGSTAGAPFVADADFFLQPDTVAKIMEGKYDNKEGAGVKSSGDKYYDDALRATATRDAANRESERRARESANRR